uniref:YceI domain-containing protein n=1 Tax=Heterorhabditis bacteriophora TaxID=37862 RepID=A0A1I7WTL4_HETBA
MQTDFEFTGEESGLDYVRIGTFQHRTENPGNDYVGMRIEGDIEITGLEFSH